MGSANKLDGAEVFLYGIKYPHGSRDTEYRVQLYGKSDPFPNSLRPTSQLEHYGPTVKLRYIMQHFRQLYALWKPH